MRKHILILFMLLSALVFAEPLDKVVAVVNDDVITASELAAQLSILKKQMMAKNMAMPDEQVLRKQVLQHLIDINLQLQIAKNNNLTIDNVELNEAIGKIAATNDLTLTQLRQEVERQGMDWKTYRENIRKEMLIARVQQKAIGQDIVVSSQQVEDYIKTSLNNKKNQVYHLQNIVIPLPEEPTTDQLKKARDKAQALLKKIKQGEDFTRLAIAESSGEYALEGGDLGERNLAELPEVFADKVVNMKVGQVAGPIRTGNGFQLIKLVALGGKQDHHEVVKTHVRHILLKQDANMTEAEAIRQINNIYEQLKSGKDFAVMAKQYSLDAASAVKGGDLGWVTAEELVPQFAKAMNALPLHKVSKPVKSLFGWHLIEVLERKTVDDSQAFQRQQVHQFLQQRKFTEAVQNWQQHLRADAYLNILDKELA
ncbi:MULTISPECIES: peptidylprolyl isomerase [Legionella]|uniref:Chaperone SurA n=1 Tax=Legionella septentrionalis TaxID=2498109 RepID=A0A433JH36_9GAMM|nr:MULTISPECIES: peptidylprolyl isomerase [Legionella]MCP0913793.1 peptidylprolyl isomerase [Legionella sp. 27cVA30]RUQ81592.1 molecular chaperone SurA [Legionella septentrionalis]RUQ96428.1 molecular chaperone SurA [Legionella septentrionalis]RUR09673.1 molecular chaperone SurA [Legionella septentrionalis]RUR14509.1 molecular chaperone SurA [Legionella septentrionalis]